MTYIAVLCVFGDETTARFERIFKSICKCPWNEFTLKIQKLLLMMLMIAEKSVHLKGYINVKCTRQFMKTVSERLENLLGFFSRWRKSVIFQAIRHLELN